MFLGETFGLGQAEHEALGATRQKHSTASKTEKQSSFEIELHIWIWETLPAQQTRERYVGSRWDPESQHLS